MKPIVESWLSLEQVSQVLGLPWITVWRWARDGDPRLPAYRVWNEGTPQMGGYRFKQQDVDALQQQPPDPTPPLLVRKGKSVVGR
jgi:hypothetical protein